MSITSVNAGLMPTQAQGNGSANNAVLGQDKEKIADDQQFGKSTVEKFLDYVNMNPIERIRAAYLEEHGLTEEQLAGMPQEERDKIEEEIRQLIEQKVTGDPLRGPSGNMVDVTA